MYIDCMKQGILYSFQWSLSWPYWFSSF